MKLGAVLSLVLLLAPMSARLKPYATATPMLSAASVSIETISKSDEDTVSLGVAIHAPQRVIATKQQVNGVWYPGSSFETMLEVIPDVVKSDFAGGDISLSPSRPLLHDWTYHCDMTLIFSDHSVMKISWRDVTLKAGAQSITHSWTVANCLSAGEAVQADHSNCTLQMTFKKGRETASN
jgi:hypothetical protein